MAKRRTVILSILIVLLLAAGGFVASLYLIPSDADLKKLIALDNAPINASQAQAPYSVPAAVAEQSKQKYFDQLNTGSLSYQAAEAYAQSLIAANDQSGAAWVWKDYVEKNPDDLAGWKEFARLQQASGDEDGYLLGLKNIARLESSEENLLALSSYQNYKQDYAGQVEALKRLVAITNESSPKYLLDLADIALLARDNEAALAALSSYYTKYASGNVGAKAISDTVIDGALQGQPAPATPAIDVVPPPPLPNVFLSPEELAKASTEAGEQTVAVDYSRLPIYIRLLAGANRKDEALSEALEHTKDGRGVGERDQVAEILLTHVGAPQAVEYIETISAQGDIPESLQTVYARALVQQGRYKAALPILKKLSVQGGDFREWYFLGLSAAAKEDPNARRDLVQHVKESFASGELTEAQKLDRVYALLNAGEKTRALDYAERSMHATNDQEYKIKWRDLYKALTIKPKPVRVARVVPRVSLNQKLALSRRSSTSTDYIRKTAFELLAAKRKDDAVELFSVLAARGGPNSSDTNQLVYLWGPRVTGSELGWLVDQAATATSIEEQAGWISIISKHAAAEDIVAIANAYPNWLGHSGFEKRYLDTLIASDDTTALYRYVTSKPAGDQDVEIYNLIASKAQSVFDFSTAEQVLQQSATVDPANRETWLRLTSLYVSRARYTAANQTSYNALKLGNQSAASGEIAARQEAEAHFYAAALAKKEGENKLSAQYLQQVVRATQDGNLTDRGSQVRLLSSLMALGNEQAASQGFEDLLAENPGDAVLFADYLSALLDRQNYDQALDVAARHGNDIVVNDAPAVSGDPSPLLIRSPSGQAPFLQTMSGGQELKLIFDRPIPANYVIYANNQVPNWVAYTTASYDTALIVAHSGYHMQAAETPDGLLVSAVPSAGVSASEAARQRYLRLQLLYARLELETSHIDKGLERLESLAPVYQEYPEYRAYQGNAEYYANNLTRGLNLVKRAEAGDPGNEDIKYLRRNIERFRGEHLLIDHEYRNLGDGDRELNITTIEARKFYDDQYEITARYKTTDLDLDSVQRSFGTIDQFDGTRWEAELSLAKFWDDSSILTGSLFANRDTLGAGLAYQFVNSWGTTGVTGAFRRPYSDVVESIVEDGTQDRVAVWHQWRPNTKWTFRGELGYNHYNIASENSIADSTQIEGLILRTIYDRQPYVALAYGLDAEYFLNSVDRSGAGNFFLPLRSREVHALNAIFYYDFSLDTNIELTGGYAIDRLGEDGVNVTGRFTHYLADRLDVQLRGSYGLDASNSDNSVLSIGGYVRWSW